MPIFIDHGVQFLRWRTSHPSRPRSAGAAQVTFDKKGPAGKYHVPIDFGAIGSGLSAVIGVAVARGSDRVSLIDGDRSLYQHIQELETLRRHSIKMLICILNDGGYGAESHKFRATGGNPGHATNGRGDLAAVARGFGLNGAKITEMGRFERLFREHQHRDGATLWNVHINDLIPSRQYRWVHYGEASAAPSWAAERALSTRRGKAKGSVQVIRMQIRAGHESGDCPPHAD